jgi:CO/xanthine dehydrogenase FAD-binding subunit
LPNWPRSRLIRAVRIPVPQQARSAYHKVAWRNASGKAVLTLAVAMRVDGGVLSQVRIVAGAITPQPRRIQQGESELEGKPWHVPLAALAAQRAADSGIVSDTYRRRLIRSHLERLILEVGQP